MIATYVVVGLVMFSVGALLIGRLDSTQGYYDDGTA